jgi:hypothetical protein
MSRYYSRNTKENSPPAPPRAIQRYLPRIQATVRDILGMHQRRDVKVRFTTSSTPYLLTNERLMIGYRDPKHAVQLHKHISAFPTEIPLPGLPKTIEILTKSVRDVLLTFLDVVSAFNKYEGGPSERPGEREVARQGTAIMNKVYAGKEAEWKRFDIQIASLESTISWFEKEIELINVGKKWDIEAQKEMLKLEKEKTEK